MDPETVLRLIREALLLVLVLSAIPVLAAMVVGLLVSLFQAATQIQEQTLTVVPKIVAVFLALGIGGLWMLRQLIQFATVLYQNIARIG